MTPAFVNPLDLQLSKEYTDTKLAPCAAHCHWFRQSEHKRDVTAMDSSLCPSSASRSPPVHPRLDPRTISRDEMHPLGFVLALCNQCTFNVTTHFIIMCMCLFQHHAPWCIELIGTSGTSLTTHSQLRPNFVPVYSAMKCVTYRATCQNPSTISLKHKGKTRTASSSTALAVRGLWLGHSMGRLGHRVAPS